MKKTTKLLAILITIALIAGMVPMFALAAEGDVVTITLGGVNIPTFVEEDSVADANTSPIAVTIPASAADGTAGRIVIQEEDIGGASIAFTGSVFYWSSATTPLATDETEVRALSAFAAQTLVTGDRLYIETANNTFIRLNITVAAAPPAGTPGSGTIGGDSTVESVVLNVVLPLNLDFVLNPLELGDNTAGSQIKTTDYVIVNKTGAPVEASFTITATGETGVTLLPNASTLEKDDTSVTDKEIFFAALGASTVTPGTLTFAATTGASFTYNAANAPFVPFVPASDGATAVGNVRFALGAATESDPGTSGLDTLAAANRGLASFQFYGELNTYAEWLASDVKVSGAYTLTPLRATTFTNYGAATGGAGSAFMADSVNQLKPAVSAAKFLAADTGSLPYMLSADHKVATMDISKTAVWPALGTVVANFDAGDNEIAAIFFPAIGATGWLMPATDWVYNDVAKTITFTQSRMTALVGAANPVNFTFVAQIFFGDEIVEAAVDLGDATNSGFSLRLNVVA